MKNTLFSKNANIMSPMSPARYNTTPVMYTGGDIMQSKCHQMSPKGDIIARNVTLQLLDNQCKVTFNVTYVTAAALAALRKVTLYGVVTLCPDCIGGKMSEYDLVINNEKL